MKVGALVVGTPLSGGGFNQSLTALLQMAKLCRDRFEFVSYTDSPKTLDTLRELGLSGELIGQGRTNRAARLVLNSAPGRKLASRAGLLSPFEARMKRDGVDLVYFPAPNGLATALMDLPYISTVWDLCHRDSPEFPEVRRRGEFEGREKHYLRTLPKSVITLVDSKTLLERVQHRYGLDARALLVMPFSPGPLVRQKSEETDQRVLSRHGLSPGYIYYPAQFWPHKNHYRLLDALRVLKERGDVRKLVFSGGDQGNLPYVRSLVERFALTEQVSFLGFVPAEEIASLYLGCGSVCMPSYFGPTNLPPLEAWSFGRPLLYANLHQEQTADAAEYFDPDDTASLASAIVNLDDPERRETLVAAGRRRCTEIAVEREVAEQELLQKLIEFDRRRACWP